MCAIGSLLTPDSMATCYNLLFNSSGKVSHYCSFDGHKLAVSSALITQANTFKTWIFCWCTDLMAAARRGCKECKTMANPKSKKNHLNTKDFGWHLTA